MMMAHSMVYGIMYITAFDFIHLFSRNSVSLRIKKEEHFRIILRPAIIRRDVEFLHGIAERCVYTFGADGMQRLAYSEAQTDCR